MTAVCRAWRNLALDAPLVWRHIQLFARTSIFGSPVRSNILTIQPAIQRSGNAPLHVTIDFTVDVSHRDVPHSFKAVLVDFATYLEPETSRISTLTVNADNAGVVCVFWAALGHAAGRDNSPQLQGLRTITCRFSGSEDSERAQFDADGSNWQAYSPSWYNPPHLTTLNAPCGLFAFSVGSLGHPNLTHLTIGIRTAVQIADIMACGTIRTARLLLRYYDFKYEVPRLVELPHRAQELDFLHFEQLPWQLESASRDEEYEQSVLDRAEEHRLLAWRALLWPRAARVLQFTYDLESDGVQTPPDLVMSIFADFAKDTRLALIFSIGEMITITVAEVDDANSVTAPFEETLGRRRAVAFHLETLHDALSSLQPNLCVNQVRAVRVEIADVEETHWDDELLSSFGPLDWATRFMISATSRESIACPLRSSQLGDWQKMLPAIDAISLRVHRDNRTVEEWEFEGWEQAASTLHGA